MIVSQLIGGLGNQLFQYAAGRALSIKNSDDYLIDVSQFLDYKQRIFLLDNFNLRLKYFSVVKKINPLSFNKYKFQWKIQNYILKKKYGLIKYKEDKIPFNEDFFSINYSCHLIGFWQSEKYFLNIKELLRDELTINSTIDYENEKILEEIQNTNSVFLHIRRGDYVENIQTNSIHGVCSIDYYLKSIKFIQDNTTNIFLYIFSDDILWVKKNINPTCKYKIVEINYLKNPVFDFNLMKHCKHQIISNSSFSWWAAWLGERKNSITIAPTNWYKTNEIFDSKDIVPDRWIRIAN